MSHGKIKSTDGSVKLRQSRLSSVGCPAPAGLVSFFVNRLGHFIRQIALESRHPSDMGRCELRNRDPYTELHTMSCIINILVL